MGEEKRRDNKGRLLLTGECQEKDGSYTYRYTDKFGKRRKLSSWRLTKADALPPRKKFKKPLRELEKEIQADIADGICNDGITVNELVERYLSLKTGVKHNTEANYKFVQNVLKKEEFGYKLIDRVRLSDAKLFLIKLQDDGRKFLKFVKEDRHFSRYYEGIYILFKTGMRISVFVGLTLSDIDLKERTIDINHQLQRKRDGTKVIETTKTNAGTRIIPMTDDVYECFKKIIENRVTPKVEPIIDGYAGFLYFDKDGNPMVTPHVCRHTYCSNMAKSGMNPKTLRYLMGHSDIGVTLKVSAKLWANRPGKYKKF